MNKSIDVSFLFVETRRRQDELLYLKMKQPELFCHNDIRWSPNPRQTGKSRVINKLTRFRCYFLRYYRYLGKRSFIKAYFDELMNRLPSDGSYLTFFSRKRDLTPIVEYPLIRYPQVGVTD